MRSNKSWLWFWLVIPVSAASCDPTAADLDLEARPNGVALEPSSVGLTVCSSLQLHARTVPLVGAQDFAWRSSNDAVLEVDGSGQIVAVAPGVARIDVVWVPDTLLQASAQYPVTSIGPGLLSIGNFTNANEPVSSYALSGVVDVQVDVWVNAYTDGEIELLVDGQRRSATGYPSGCPQRTEQILIPLDTRGLASGHHELVLGVVSGKDVLYYIASEIGVT